MKHPAIPYVAPMAVFVLFLAVGKSLGLGQWEFPLWVAALAAVLWYFSRNVISLRTSFRIGSVVLGILVFLIWVGPDYLWPAYRTHWLFQNAIFGKARTSLPAGFEMAPVVLVFRTVRAVIIVPVVEELFWRGFLMRWLIKSDFESVPLGSYAPGAFWITAALFASEHGPYWEVGLVTGALYNWLMVRTRSLGDCILAHAVTNGILCAYVMLASKWEYWL